MILINNSEPIAVYRNGILIVAIYTHDQKVWPSTIICCFGNGYWLDEYPWADDVPWVD